MRPVPDDCGMVVVLQFCQGVLWPLFHCINSDNFNEGLLESFMEQYEAYAHANQCYLEASHTHNTSPSPLPNRFLLRVTSAPPHFIKPLSFEGQRHSPTVHPSAFRGGGSDVTAWAWGWACRWWRTCTSRGTWCWCWTTS
jgi:hypothetical protein